MRVALLSDIHANGPALDAALAVLRHEGVDRYISAGDAVGYGPHPNECLAVLRQLDAVCVLGNHELRLLGRLPRQGYGRRALASLDWSERLVLPDHRAWLETLPSVATLGPLVVAHGSLDDPQEYVLRPRQAQRQLRLVDARYGAGTVLVLGHTHYPMLRTPTGVPRPVRGGTIRTISAFDAALVNPGSVGQSRQREPQPRVRFALADLGARTIAWFAVPYDHEATRRDLAEAGLPPGSVHARPSASQAARRMIATLTDLRRPRPLRRKRPTRDG